MSSGTMKTRNLETRRKLKEQRNELDADYGCRILENRAVRSDKSYYYKMASWFRCDAPAASTRSASARVDSTTATTRPRSVPAGMAPDGVHLRNSEATGGTVPTMKQYEGFLGRAPVLPHSTRRKLLSTQRLKTKYRCSPASRCLIWDQDPTFPQYFVL